MFIVLATDKTGKRFLAGTFDVAGDATAKIAVLNATGLYSVAESKNVSAFSPANLIPLQPSPL